MASNDFARGLTSGRVSIGGSLCIGFTAGDLVNSWLITYVSGGTACFMVGQSTMASGYRISQTPITIGGPASFWVNNGDGVTTVIEYVKTLTGFTSY